MALETAPELASLYEFSTESGVVIPQTEKVKERIEKLFLDVFGSDLDLSEETPVGRIIEALTVMYRTTLGVTAQNANQFNINTATGIYLDSLAQVYGMTRSAEQRTQVYVTVRTTGIGVTVPSGALVENSATRSVFRIVNPIVVPPNETVGRGLAEAVDAGPEPAEEGDITIINSGTLGWLSVTNESAVSIGRFVESDEEFRKRLIDSRPIGMAFLQSIYSRVSRVEGVSSCVVYENNGARTILSNGVPIPGHSLFVCVQGGEDSEIAKAIADTKTPGTGLTNTAMPGTEGTTIEPVIVPYMADGVSLDVSFYRPEQVKVYVSIEVDTSLYTGEDAEGAIKNAIEEFVTTKGVGERITSAEVSRAVSSAVPTVTPVSTTLSLASEQSAYGPFVTIAGYQISSTDEDHIRVMVVES